MVRCLLSSAFIFFGTKLRQSWSSAADAKWRWRQVISGKRTKSWCVGTSLQETLRKETPSEGQIMVRHSVTVGLEIGIRGVGNTAYYLYLWYAYSAPQKKRCHPCIWAMLIFSVSFQFYWMFPNGPRKKRCIHVSYSVTICTPLFTCAEKEPLLSHSGLSNVNISENPMPQKPKGFSARFIQYFYSYIHMCKKNHSLLI